MARAATVGVVLVGAVAGQALGQARAPRPFTVDALLHLESLGTVAPSPDGKYVAIVVARPQSDGARWQMSVFDSRTRSDIWAVRIDNGRRQQLTHGAPTGSGWWNPVWSPDGKRLAMLSNDGGNVVRAWVWDVGDPAPRRLSDRSVDLWVFTDAVAQHFQPLNWLDDTTLLLPLLPRGADSRLDLIASAEAATIRGWAAARAGRVPTASVLESDPGRVPPYLSEEEIVAVNVDKQSSRVIATIPRDPTTSGQRMIVLSPDRRMMAVVTAHLDAPTPARRLPRGMSRYRFGFVGLGHPHSMRWVGEFAGSDTLGYEIPVPTWSPNGTALAVIGRRLDTGNGQPGLFRVDAGTGRIDILEPCQESRLQCLGATWTSDGTLLALVRSASGRTDWWTVDSTGLDRNLTRQLKSAPNALLPAPAAGIVYALGDSSIGRIDVHNGDVTAFVPRALEHRAARIVRPQFGPSGGPDASCVIAEVRDSTRGISLIAFDPSQDIPRAIAVGELAPGSIVDACLPGLAGAIVRRRDRSISRVGTAGSMVLFDINDWADMLEPARKLFVRYLDSDGDSLGAVLLLPSSYVAEQRYPLVVWVYAGATYQDTSQVRTDRVNSSPYNLLLLAAHGYAVLWPSIPLWPDDSAGGDVLPRLQGAVLPAIDRVEALGLVDPQRVAVMGQSFGGYTTLGLITTTRRFRSAVALAVASDLVSQSGTLRPWDRPFSNAHVTLATPKLLESGQVKLGGSLWAQPWRYIENSPVFHADRVETPVMIIQGDQDFQGPGQAEEFFTAMYRLGKRATLVRYLGEGHVIESPANIRDMWRRIDDWLALTLGSADPDASRAVPSARGGP